MRYYSVNIAKADGTPYIFKSLGMPLTSLLPSGPQNPQTGITNPAALQIELDIGAYNLTDPDQNALLRVWGLGLQDIGSASDLNNLSVEVSAGMAKGLPLANPAQAGIIMKGHIFQAFGNWIGTDQTVDMLFVPGPGATGSPAQPQNFPFNMTKGMPMATAIQNTLKVAMPALTVVTNINANLVLNYDQPGHYESLAQFADFIRALSQGIIGGDYPGVTIAQDGSVINVFDTTPGQKPVTAIAFRDMIGQPTWIDAGTVSLKTVLRSDIHVGDVISLPQSLFTQTAPAYLSLQDRSTFSGKYQVAQVHHYGNYRQPDAASWNTTFQVTAQPK